MLISTLARGFRRRVVFQMFLPFGFFVVYSGGFVMRGRGGSVCGFGNVMREMYVAIVHYRTAGVLSCRRICFTFDKPVRVGMDLDVRENMCGCNYFWRPLGDSEACG